MITTTFCQMAILNVRFSSFGFWVLDVLILLALAVVVIVLATDDRDPSTVLAWLFVIMLFPVGGIIIYALIGLIAYFFFGRNYRRDSRRRQRRPSTPAGLTTRNPLLVVTPARSTVVRAVEGPSETCAALDALLVRRS
jgi:heme/copper-type cytochrome/quinol oxidase subunit 2